MIKIPKMIPYALAVLFLSAAVLWGPAAAQNMGPGYRGGMMGGMMGSYSGIPAPLPHDKARAIADSYLAFLNNPGLEIDEFEEYSHNYYVSLVEKSTGRGAIEIIIDRYSGSYHPEPQSMMWNGKYGMLSVNGYSGDIWYHTWHGMFISE